MKDLTMLCDGETLRRISRWVVSDKEPYEILKLASEHLNGFGVESVVGNDGTELLYVNMGDTYDLTLAHDGGDFLVIDWGSWYESVRDQHCEETGEDNCCYCSSLDVLKYHRAENWEGYACDDCRTN